MTRKKRVHVLVAVLTISAVVIVAGVVLLSQNHSPGEIQIRLSSDPFPLAVGPAALLVTLTDEDGAPVENAAVTVSGQTGHAGMPLAGQTSRSQNGEYRVSLTVPRMGSWMFDVSATLPDRSEPLREQFEIFTYAIPARSRSSVTTYRSVSEIDALRTSGSPEEMWIVIPQGAEAMIRMGQSSGIIPEEILLSLSGQNVLVIRNDDIAHHNVGPFFVQAGETIRQRFTSPTVLQGACSINQVAEVSIIVEG